MIMQVQMLTMGMEIEQGQQGAKYMQVCTVPVCNECLNVHSCV